MAKLFCDQKCPKCLIAGGICDQYDGHDEGPDATAHRCNYNRTHRW